MMETSHGRIVAEVCRADASAWLEANAGSGKTHVLTERVIGLLLAEVPPEQILCLTYTRAAAAEMSRRILVRLRAWAVLNETRLAEDLNAQLGKPPSQSTINQARKLFARVLETPGGLKVQTIHGFCTHVLKRFPREAGLTADFRVADDQTMKFLFERARRAEISKSDPMIVKSLAVMNSIVSDTALNAVLDDICMRDEIWMSHSPSDPKRWSELYISAVRHALGIKADETREGIHHLLLRGPHVSRQNWKPMADQLDEVDCKRAKEVARLLREADQATAFPIIESAYLSIFQTRSGEFRKRVSDKTIRSCCPDIAENLEAEKRRLETETIVDKLRAFAVVEASGACLTLAAPIRNEMELQKQGLGLVGYSEIISRTRKLLENECTSWVRYRLDREIDHILIDEAQDTSSDQWNLIDRLSSEFFAGETARRLPRTVFAVGDIKQSIYSFQGARIENFSLERDRVERKTAGSGRIFFSRSLLKSFRSAPAILSLVDRVFQDDTALSVGAPASGTSHQAVRSGSRGLVEVWPVVCSQKAHTRSEPASEARSGLDEGNENISPVEQLSEYVVRKVQELVAGGERIAVRHGSGEREVPIRPEHILILLQSRKSRLFPSLYRAFATTDFPVAGADRLVLSEHIAIRDLLALASWSIHPHDDYALACALKSPLFDWTDEDLMRIGPQRDDTLWHAIQSGLSATADHNNTKKRLQAVLERASNSTPSQFFSSVLYQDWGRQRFFSRMGAAVFDVLDAFMEEAAHFELEHGSSLMAFIHSVQSNAAELRREASENHGELRIMTVHGAKGLESPVVILPDTTRRIVSPGNSIVRLAGKDPKTPTWVWARGTEKLPRALSDEKSRLACAEMAESLRLLYVAMTRARDRLYIGGALQKNQSAIREGCWYALIDRAAGDAERVNPPPDRSDAGSPVEQELTLLPRPPWYGQDFQAARDFPRYVSPSARLNRLQTSTSPGKNREKAIHRGTLLHWLLEHVFKPGVDDPVKQARTLISMYQGGTYRDEASVENILNAIAGLAASPECMQLLSQSAQCEVPVQGTVCREGCTSMTVNGRIDRVIRSERHVQLVDAKTGIPPHSLADIPTALFEQMALYRAILTPAEPEPEQTLVCKLLWIDGPRIDELEDTQLDAALLRIVGENRQSASG